MLKCAKNVCGVRRVYGVGGNVASGGKIRTACEECLQARLVVASDEESKERR